MLNVPICSLLYDLLNASVGVQNVLLIMQAVHTHCCPRREHVPALFSDYAPTTEQGCTPDQACSCEYRLTFDSFFGCLEPQTYLLPVPLPILAGNLPLVCLFAAKAAKKHKQVNREVF